ncbi:MAG: hypothetical protein DRQ61_04180 [Gammaproteobacteria bacterium]|nr:MAG: hypothetical protein DRQ61_04180 [Gammaproteobacteria bacterium]
MNAFYKNSTTLFLIFIAKSGPQNLTESRLYLVLLGIPLLMVDSVLASKVTGIDQGTMIYFSVIRISVISGGIWFWLRINEVTHRYIAVMMALFAIGLVAQILKMPLLPITPDKPRIIAAFSGFILLWQFVMSVRVLNAAVKKSFLKTGLLLIALNLAGYTAGSKIMSAVVGHPVHMKSVPPSTHR